MSNQILYLDLETTKQEIIRDVGALYNGQEIHENSLVSLEAKIKESKYICGHNILAHDIPILKERLGKETFVNKIYIDTLLWSPLLFADRPYHNLVKGYKIINEKDHSNPLSDCKLTKTLLQDEIDQFDQLSEDIKVIFYHLLKSDYRFNGLFKYLGYYDNSRFYIENIYNLFDNKVCHSINFEKLASEFPVALAYALAVINTAGDDSICPYWVSNFEPKAQEILEEIRFHNCGEDGCVYCRNNLDIKKSLFQYFGYSDFRKFDYDEEISLQERTVKAGIQNQSFVAVFPTGGGKSLTFQLPGLMKGSLTRQLTVVISPLVSLMKDQVDVLQSRFGINKAVAINGLLSPLERKDAIERVQDGRAHLLYISPESLRSPTISRLLKERALARIVIDEAHCFSSWGQDFRVDYLYIGEFIRQINESRIGHSEIPVSCFTATAKPQVIGDIKKYFSDKLELNLSEFITRSERKNLQYEVIGIKESEEKPIKLLSILSNCDKPAIIYCSRIKKVEEVTSIINKNGMNVTHFHGKMQKDDKIRNQNSFMNGDSDIIVATSAFGMGVDKDDVKTVIHFDISDSLENYIQEAGRAGRKDDIIAKCYILFNEDDLNKHFSLVQQTKINQKEIQEIWRAVKGLSKFRESMSHSALEIAKRAGWETEVRELENKVTTSISALEDKGFLERRQNTPRVFADSCIPTTNPVL